MQMMYNEYAQFNRFPNLDGLEWKIINKLVNDTSKYAENIWKLLKYPTEDALVQPNLTRQEKLELICSSNDTGETGKRVFITPYINDAWTEQSAHIHIYVDALHPVNHIISNVHITFETIVHSKVGTINGDTDNDNANPNDSNIDGVPIVIRKNRETVLLKSLLALLNGMEVDGVGVLQFNQMVDPYCTSTQYLWNNRAYYGHVTRMVVKMSGSSLGSNIGY